MESKRPPAAPGGVALPGVPPGGRPVAWGALALLEKLGEDRFGERYRAHDPVLGCEVTLRLRPASPAGDLREARFANEARRLTRIRHTNLVQVLGVDRRDRRLGVWTERLAGQKLEEVLARDGPLPPTEVRRIGLELCRALTALHSAGIVHREVRTTCVLLGEGGRVVLLDSGSLGDLPPADGSGDHGEEWSARDASPATDVYRLGILLYRLATRQNPIESVSAPELIERQRRRQFVPLRERRPALPIDFVRVIERAVDPDPVLRFPNALELERALAVTLTTPTTAELARAAAALPARPRLLERSRRVVSALGALALGSTIAVIMLGEARRAPDATGTATSRRAGVPAAPGAPVASPAPGEPSAAAPAEPEEKWVYKPIRHTDPLAPPPPRVLVPPRTQEEPASGAVAGATALLRALAQGPPMPPTRGTAAELPAYLSLSTVPPEAIVTIDGVPQDRFTPAAYRVTPGPHTILVEKPGFTPQEMAPVDFAPGQKLRASLTLSPAPEDSL